ncbi:MAG: MFS transporter [Chloroflexota bacterium]
MSEQATTTDAGQTSPMTTTQRWTMLAAILGSGVVFLDGTIVNVALKRIGELPSTIFGTLEGQTYVTSGYLATLAALLVLAGALADYYGRRRVFAIGLVGFGVTSLLCGLAPTLEILVLARVLQGATGALLVPGSIAVITALFDGPMRARAFGIWAAATSAVTPIGVLLGGTLVDTIGWRAAFLINIPLIGIALFATIRHMPETRDEQASGRFDWLGAALAIVAVGGIAFGTIRSQQQQWRDPGAIAAILIGVVALIAFPIVMARRKYTLVPLSLFRIRSFAVINLATLLIYAALYGILGFQPLFLQGVIGYSATAAGITGLPVGILLAVFSTRVGTVAGRIGARRFLVTGPLLMAAGYIWYARIPSTSAPWDARLTDVGSLIPPTSVLVDIVPSVLLIGVGISLVVAPLTATLMSSVPVRNAGLASAINNAISRVGQPILAALIFVVVSGAFYASLGTVAGVDASDPALRSSVQPLNPPGPQVPEAIAAAARIASTDAFHLAAIVGATLLVAGALTSWFGLRPSGQTTTVGATRESDRRATPAASGPG